MSEGLLKMTVRHTWEAFMWFADVAGGDWLRANVFGWVECPSGRDGQRMYARFDDMPARLRYMGPSWYDCPECNGRGLVKPEDAERIEAEREKRIQEMIAERRMT